MTNKEKANLNNANKQRHKELLQELHTTYVAKNADYGSSFSETFDKLGVISAATRILDKTNRFTNLAISKDTKVNDESITDTLMDLANYCLLTVMEIENSKK